MLKIRRATGYDKKEIDEFFSDMDSETKLFFNKTGKSYRRVISFIEGGSSENVVFVAEYNGTLAGILVICGYDYSIVWISLCVSEKFRRKRIGTTLLRFADDFVAKNKGGGILLSVNKKNLPAVSLYEKHGYTRLGESNGEYVYVKSYRLY